MRYFLLCLLSFAVFGCHPDFIECDPDLYIPYHNVGNFDALYNDGVFKSNSYYKDYDSLTVFTFGLVEEHKCYNEIVIDFLLPISFQNISENDTIYLKSEIGSLNMKASSDSILSYYELCVDVEKTNWVIFNNKLENQTLVGELNLVYERIIPQSGMGILFDEELFPDKIVISNGSFISPLVE